MNSSSVPFLTQCLSHCYHTVLFCLKLEYIMCNILKFQKSAAQVYHK